MILRTLLSAAALLAALAAGASPAIAAWPERPLRLIVPTTAGSVPDVIARLIGERLAEALGQQVVVDNRPGGGGTIGLQALARAAPDGYTLGLQTLPFVITPALVPTMPYDIERDLQPVTLLDWNHAVLVVPASSPLTSVADVVREARANPGALTYASGGNATPSHLTFALLEQQTGIRLTHVPYKGGPAAATAVIAGEVNLYGASVGLAGTNVKAGKLRALATSAPRRIAAMPEVPTLLELGYAGVELSDWQGIVVPAGTPRDVVLHLHAALARIIALPEVRARLGTLGMEPAGMGPDEFAAYQAGEMRKWHALVRTAGIRAD